ncbi:MAG: CHASE2 domain-containing protein [Nitrospirota bacterium]
MYFKIAPLEMLEEKLFDLRFKIRGKVVPPTDVVIAAIDEKSLEKLGRWPWSRDKMAKLTGILDRGGAKVIVFDILFAEAEENDAVFAEAIKKASNVLLPIAFDFDKETALVEEDFIYASSISAIKNVSASKVFPPIKAIGLRACRKELSEAAIALGHINMIPDKDGTLRWETMVIEYDLDLYPSIDLQIVRVYQGLGPEKVSLMPQNPSI